METLRKEEVLHTRYTLFITEKKGTIICIVRCLSNSSRIALKQHTKKDAVKLPKFTQTG